MRERERVVVGGLVTLMLLLWLGFLVHRSPRFPGSLEGSLLGIAAAPLMAVPLAYVAVKRIRPLRRRFTARVSLRTFLAWHIYAGILAPMLALLHTGHRFESRLGIALTASMLIVALSGFVGRYLLRMIGEEAKDRRGLRDALRAEYDRLAAFVRASPEQAAIVAPLAGPVRGWLGRVLFDQRAEPARLQPPALQALRVADALADVEYAVHTQEAFKRWFSRWLRIHIVLTFLLYALLTAHVAIELTLGLRWL